MRKWMGLVGVVLIGFVGGWFAAMRVSAPRETRCHEALQFMSKGATMDQLSRAAKILSGE